MSYQIIKTPENVFLAHTLSLYECDCWYLYFSSEWNREGETIYWQEIKDEVEVLQARGYQVVEVEIVEVADAREKPSLAEMALLVIENMAMNKELDLLPADYEPGTPYPPEMQDWGKVYQLAHVARAPCCSHNHPEWKDYLMRCYNELRKPKHDR